MNASQKSSCIGQVGFRKEKMRRYTRVEERVNSIINRLNRSKVEKETEVFKKMKRDWERKNRAREKRRKAKEAKEERIRVAQEQKKREEASYDRLAGEAEEMTSNAQTKDIDS